MGIAAVFVAGYLTGKRISPVLSGMSVLFCILGMLQSSLFVSTAHGVTLVAATVFFAAVFSLTDMSDGYIYDKVVYACIFTAFLLRSSAGVKNAVCEVCAGCAAGALPLLTLYLLLRIFSSRDALGGGDVTMFAGLGALLGPYAVWAVLYSGCVLGGIWALLCVLSGRKKLLDTLPFAPFAALGILVVEISAMILYESLGIDLNPEVGICCDLLHVLLLE